MSDNTVNAALRRLGYDTKTEMTGHGFRAMARTILDEVLHVRPEIVEHQLAHAVRDPLGRAYCSPKKVRCVVWKFFEKQFQTQNGCLDLPKSKYGEAKRFVDNLELDSVRPWAVMSGLVEVLPEERPSGEEIKRRARLEINAHRAKYGLPPLSRQRPNVATAN